jgi:hypothetical protein
MATKQTALDFFIDELESKGDCWENVSIGKVQISIPSNEYYALKTLAKQKEKEQIIKANCFNRCLNNQTYECSMKAFADAEQYYNENYGGDNE